MQIVGFFPHVSFFSIPISLKQGHVASVYQICSDSALKRVPWLSV